uniref:Uncharacterized protein n=1 Tax=Macrostomum lignano TaxID=282301 RepID=A0A1I8GCH2_9PLAT
MAQELMTRTLFWKTVERCRSRRLRSPCGRRFRFLKANCFWIGTPASSRRR